MSVFKDETPEPKMPRLDVQSGTAGTRDVCEVSVEPQAPAALNSKSKDTGARKPMGRGQRRHPASVPNAWVGCREEGAVQVYFFGPRQPYVQNGVR
ncbi:hypothetical protein MTO96_009837 [Rhipicephalus appendiculatus]